MKVKGRRAVITGASQGIGRAIALKFGSEGFDLVLNSRSSDDLNRLKEELISSNPDISVETVPADLSTKEGVEEIVNVCQMMGGAIDVLVNNAGIFLPGDVLTEEDGRMEQMMAINFYSAYHLTRGLLTSLQRSDRSYIINMCSVAGLKAYPGGGSYGISKFAMLGWSKNLRLELQDSRTAVTAIMPGATWSRSWQGADQPRERLMEARNIANVCWMIVNLEPNAVVEEVIIRPQLGDL